jgi:hypothetical protein
MSRKTIQQLESELSELEANAKQPKVKTVVQLVSEKPVPIITPQMSPLSSGILDFSQFPITERERTGFENSNPRDRGNKILEEYIGDKRAMDFFMVGQAGGAFALKSGLIDESSFFAGE